MRGTDEGRRPNVEPGSPHERSARSSDHAVCRPSYTSPVRRREGAIEAAAVGTEPVAPQPGSSVLYVGGCQRSGSTLVDRMLSQLDGHVSAGEVVHLWTRGLLGNELCGCGEAFWVCPFWSEIGRAAFGGWDRVDPDELIALQRRVDRNRYIPLMLMPSLSARYRRDLGRYTDLLSRLYAALAARGGVVVDSSKHPSTAFLLRRVPGVRLRVIHLVRDSRGVVHSLSKQVRRPEVVDREAYMHRPATWRAAVEWVALNALFHLLSVTNTRSVRVRYEDVVGRPADAIAELGRVASHERLAFVDGNTVTLGADHTVAGNPMRFAHGRVALRLDDGWRRSMRATDRILTTVLTAPLLLAYGYRLRRR